MASTIILSHYDVTLVLRNVAKGTQEKDEMKNPISEAVKNRELDIETRIGIMYIATGIIAAIVGFLVCVVCHASRMSIVVTLTIAAVASLVLIVGFSKKNMTFVRNAITILVIILIPAVFLTAGGNNSGCPAWFLYELYFITLSCSGKLLYANLVIASAIDISLSIMDFYGAEFIYHLPTTRDIFISTIMSWIIVGLAVLYTVLTYKKIYNDEREILIKQSEELERANNFERKFLANMSHELRTPINSIIGLGEMIARKSTEEKVLEYTKGINISAEHLLTLVNDILDLSKIEAGEITINETEYDFAEGVFKAYQIVKKQAQNKGIGLVVEMDPNIPATLIGDKERILQVLINLLTNAIKYTEKGKVTLKLEAIYSPNNVDQVTIRVSVIDTGIGIPKEKLDTIFDAYKRVDKNVSEIQGTGLGLAICKNYMELMNGTLEVQSVYGAGSIFIATAPQQIASKETVGRFDLDERLARATINDTTTGFKIVEEGTKILVVDDTAMNLRVFEHLLEDSGADIICASSGQQAIDMAEDTTFDLVFMDIMMPNMNGIDAMKRIRKIQPEVPMIALTANAVSGAKEEYLNEGFNDYLSKPVKSSELEKTIIKYAGHRKK